MAVSNRVAVFDENRTLDINDGSFTDNFDSSGVHIYVVGGATAPGAGSASTFEQPVKDGINVSPNPFTSVVTVSTEGSLAISGIQIYDTKGVQVRSFRYKPVAGNVHTLPLQTLAPGVYIFKFETNKGLKVKKLIRK